MAPASTTLAVESQSVAHSACHSVDRPAKRRTSSSVQPAEPRTPSTSTSASG